jgi:D-threo-aldose 1-dehydrogenase
LTGEDGKLQAELVGSALAHDVRVFDTAPIYGNGSSETNLGAALARLDARPMISSKVFYQDVDGELRRAPADGFGRASVRESLTRLRRDHLDVLFLHNRLSLRIAAPRARRGPGPEIGVDEFLAANGVGERLGALRAEGLVRAVGITGMGSDPAAMIQAIESGTVDCLTYDVNLVSVSTAARADAPNMFDAVRSATRAGLPVHAIRVLAKGVFTGPMPSWHDIVSSYPGIEHTETTVPPEKLWAACRADDLNYSQFATGFTLSLPWVASIIGGFSNLTHLTEALTVRDVVSRLLDN